MTLYRCNRLNYAGRVLYSEEYDAPDDDHACEVAAELSDRWSDYEVREGHRLIRRGRQMADTGILAELAADR